MKSRYYKCRTSGIGMCWSCNKKTNWIFEDNKDDSETFQCNSCFTNHTKDFKGKTRIMRNLHIKNTKRGILQ